MAQEERIEALLGHLTLAQKAAVVAGSTLWTTTSLPDAGVPQLKVSDGPNGARGEHFVGGPPSACFSVGIALAATWNPVLVREVAEALALEARDKRARMLLGPTINLHRTPLGGRNFECFSEDPHLTARMAVAYVRGLQTHGVAACVKHLVANDTEYERYTISSDVPQRALHELYLEPFRAAVVEAKVWGVMTGFNRLNGTYCSEHGPLLDHLRTDWGFDGVVVSDWGGTYSTGPAATHGIDLEMPGPPKFFGPPLLTALESSTVPVTAVDDKVRRLLRLMGRTGALDAEAQGRDVEEVGVDRAATRVVARRSAAESMVLLRNEGAFLPLPLAPLTPKTLAVIGPFARDAQVQGGGSAKVTPHYTVSPYEGITQLAAGYDVVHHAGCSSGQYLPLLDTTMATAGLRVTFYNHDACEGPVAWEHSRSTAAEWLYLGPPRPEVPGDVFALSVEGDILMQEGGTHTFGLLVVGYARLYLDGVLLIDRWDEFTAVGPAFFACAGAQALAEVALAPNTTHRLVVHFRKKADIPLTGLRIGHQGPQPSDPLAEAGALAARADAVVLCLGLGEDYDCEAQDKAHLDLPDRQLALLDAVASANENVVVVLNIGSPVVMPWLPKVKAVLLAWYAGQELGNAVADALFGVESPSGRLPQTFPRRLEDTPAFLNYPGEEGHVLYGEGVFVGYRYYLAKRLEPLFHFGFGLSYTEFLYTALSVTWIDTDTGRPTTEVRVDVTNTGHRPGKEVVQVYVHPVAPRVQRPPWELKALDKVDLQPGATRTVLLTLGPRAFAYYSPSKKCWVADRGDYAIAVGRDAGDMVSERPLHLPRDFLIPDTDP